jgi:hypothetical protein
MASSTKPKREEKEKTEKYKKKESEKSRKEEEKREKRWRALRTRPLEDKVCFKNTPHLGLRSFRK